VLVQEMLGHATVTHHEHLRYLAVIVTFYPSKPTADVSAAGFAFENEQAARVVLAQFLAQGTSVEDEVGEAMANGGVYVAAPADGARELTHGPSP
jgi:hypothetical protein